MVSFTGIVTFKNADPKLLEVVKKAPLDRIMVETDAPFLAPVPNRGKRNEPAFTADTAKRIAELREISFEELAQKTTENAERFFSV
jgi:TatD DNase family protein